MRRNRALKRGRVLAILVVGAAGYVVGNWHAIALRSPNLSTAPRLSPAENVALRFPDVPAGPTSAADATPDVSTGAPSPASPANAMGFGGAQLALMSPEPMAGAIVAQPVSPAAMPAVSDQPVSLPAAERRLAPAAPPRAENKPKPAAQPRAELKTTVDSAAHHANRPGFVLNDAQIASIKNRLHLTPDQEQMWPSVEAALRSIAYAKARDAKRQGAAAAIASLDPDSVEVQGLKSAAFPLILSFSDEQKNEVRSLAHVMGLDQLASAF